MVSGVLMDDAKRDEYSTRGINVRLKKLWSELRCLSPIDSRPGAYEMVESMKLGKASSSAAVECCCPPVAADAPRNAK